MIDDEFKKYLHERLESLHAQNEQTREAQLATVRAVRNLADKLTQVETRRQTDDNELARLTGAVSFLASKLNEEKTITDLPIIEPLPPPPNAEMLKKRDDEPTGSFKRRDPSKHRDWFYVGLGVTLVLALLATAVILGWSIVGSHRP